jgi:hypothetical protein
MDERRGNPMYSAIGCKLQCNNLQRGASNSLYDRARQRGQRGQLWGGLTGRSRALLALGNVNAACIVEAQSYGGIHTVAIDRIRGSESRSADFDCDFNPLREHNRDRWLSIAEARERGKDLPPVALVQIGDLYFVRDGHHRISVARALGQQAIEARVVVWQVAGALPWEMLAQSASLANKGLFSKLRCEGARLQERALLSFRELLGAVGTTLRRPAILQPGVDGL